MNAEIRSAGGFTFVEILVVLAVLFVLLAVTVMALRPLQDRMLLNDARSGIGFHLEEAKARAVAGTGGLPHGIFFDENAYVQFRGPEYDPADPANVVHQVDDRLVITTDILGSDQAVIFARITGSVGDAVRITVALRADPDSHRVITVGAGGDIAYEE